MSKSIISAILGTTIALSTAFCSRETTETPAAEQLHGYMIANYTIHDQETFAMYMEASDSLAAQYNGKVIIYDVNARTWEGSPNSVIAVAEFPGVAEAELFYNSPEYTAAREFRIASTEGWVVLTEGFASATTTTEAEQPHGYMIANYTINDQETFARYMEAAGSLAPNYNGSVIIYNENTRVLEGDPESVIAVAEFPSVSETERFYNSPEYTAAREFRIASTEGSVLLTSALY